MRIAASRLDPGFSTLKSRGLNLLSVLDTAAAAEVAPGLAPLAGDWPTLVLIGSAGKTLWQSMTAARAFEPLDPVDEYCEEALFDFCEDLEPHVETRILWPDPNAAAAVPITRLGELAGWSHRSPLGLGIHPTFGLWFAYRGVVLLDARVPPTPHPPTPSPCASCADRPCVAACPPGAIGGPKGLDVAACSKERNDSPPCASACIARAACPIAAEHRYSPEQMAHHQRFSAASMARAVEHQASAPPEWSER